MAGYTAIQTQTVMYRFSASHGGGPCGRSVLAVFPGGIERGVCMFGQLLNRFGAVGNAGDSET